MITEVLMTEVVEKVLHQHPHAKVVWGKIRLLTENPRHPSLNAHRVQMVKEADIWECYISHSERLLYEVKDGVLRLWDLGGHGVVDTVHLRSFAPQTRFNRMDMPLDSLPSLPSEPTEPAFQPYMAALMLPKTPVLPQHGSPNRFAYFQNAHLRILGVPAYLVQRLKTAPSLEAALALPDLSVQTRSWLEELSTSPELDHVMFDSSRLLYRTTLDRLDGYCEGKIKRLMLNLQRPEQQRFVDMERTPLILLKGAAGSGKTTVGIYRAIRLAVQERNVLVLTYNKTLSSVTKSLIEELIGPLPKNLQVFTAYSLMLKILASRSITLNLPRGRDQAKIAQLLRDALNEVRMKDAAQVLKRDEKFFDEEIRRVIKGLGLKNLAEYKSREHFGRKTALGATQREAVWKVYLAYQKRLAQAKLNDWPDIAPLVLDALEARPIQTPFDDVVVDEAQDLTPVELQVIRKLVEAPAIDPVASPRGIMILADAAQTLYSRGFSWKQAGLQAVGRTAVLRKNFRNTRQIAEAAAHLLEQNTLMRASNEYVDPEWTQRQGPSPMLVTAQSPFGQIELVRERILDLVSDQAFRLSDFAVLCPTNWLCEQCQKDLEQAGLRTVLHKDSDFDLLEERVKILTIHSAKGLEFPVVFLVGLTHGTLPSRQGLEYADPEEAQLFLEQQRMLCYVGMTRAAEALYMHTVKGAESRFVNELADKVIILQ